MYSNQSNVQFLSAALAQTFQGVGNALRWLSLPDTEQHRLAASGTIQNNSSPIQMLPTITEVAHASTASFPERPESFPPQAPKESSIMQNEFQQADEALLQSGIDTSFPEDMLTC